MRPIFWADRALPYAATALVLIALWKWNWFGFLSAGVVLLLLIFGELRRIRERLPERRTDTR